MDTAGGSLRQPCRAGEAAVPCSGDAIAQLPDGPLQPTVGAVAGAAWGRRREGPPLGRGKQSHSFPHDPSGWPHPEWAVCGISIVLCRAGMWRPDPGLPVRYGEVGGTFHRSEGGGTHTRPVGRSAARRGPARPAPSPQPPAASSLPACLKPENSLQKKNQTFKAESLALTSPYKQNNGLQAWL